MTAQEIVVTVGGLGAVAFLAWYFFGPKRAGRTEVKGNLQEVKITVKGGYSPDVIRVRQGIPLRLVFDRQESSDCTSRVVFPDFRISKTLAPFGTTIVEFTPEKSGTFGFACGMNMLHGTIVAEQDGIPLQDHGGVNGDQVHQEPFAQAVGKGPELKVNGLSRAEFAILVQIHK